MPSLGEICQIEPNTNKIKYINWHENNNLIVLVAEFGFFDVIDINQKESIYGDVISNDLKYLNDVKFLQGQNNSKILMADCDSVRIFDIHNPYIQEKIISKLMIGYNKITLSIHDPNMFVFQFSDSSFTYFDIRQRYKMNLFYYPILTDISDSVDHCDICPTRPCELALCYLYQKIALYDLRMISPGIPKIIPSKGLIGVIEPFYDYRRPIITSIAYSSDGLEFICMDYSGYTKIISCDPKLDPETELGNSHLEFYSRTSYACLNFQRDVEDREKYEDVFLKELKQDIYEMPNQSFRFTYR
ncbi:hypothetical protein RF11_07273 [Thelohanellus kitauei]|uniref:Uncharacterized protein n=1 Tax=Thelohanellus kitauei TaxID=669202 RepID=A0A0C2MR31_THEKT|nr:hypothetical protein RF11_07273 [Thelohanellus kitauei]